MRTASSGQRVRVGERPRGLAPRLALLAGDQQESAGPHEVLDRQAVALVVLEPGVRERRARAGGGLVDADVVRARGAGVPSGTIAGRVVGCSRTRRSAR